MRGLSDAQRAELVAGVEKLARATAREMAGLESDGPPRPDLPDRETQQMWLATLTSLLALRDGAEQLAASAALSAAQYGADYPAIGDAAGMTRQGARRKWPGLAGSSDEYQRKLTWWNNHRDEFIQRARTVLNTAPPTPYSTALSAHLATIEQASPGHGIETFDKALVDAHALAVGTPSPTDPAAAYAHGQLAALTADAYAAMNNHPSFTATEHTPCDTENCPADPIVYLWHPADGHQPNPACHRHALTALRHPGTRIVAAQRPGIALAVLAEAHNQH